jgi:[CysO sulfur-carrier protein]-S-L-cysteine hydrolase
MAEWSVTSPWILGDLLITRDALRAMEAEMVRGYEREEESCGLLAGPSSEPKLCDRVVPIENLARALHQRDPETYFRTARTFFAFQARTLDRAIADGLQTGSPVKVLYHSHLDFDAVLSGTDEAVLSGGVMPASSGAPGTLGRGPEWPIAFLVSSVRGTPDGPRVDAHQLYVWRQGRFHESTLTITG